MTVVDYSAAVSATQGTVRYGRSSFIGLIGAPMNF